MYYGVRRKLSHEISYEEDYYFLFFISLILNAFDVKIRMMLEIDMICFANMYHLF